MKFLRERDLLFYILRVYYSSFFLEADHIISYIKSFLSFNKTTCDIVLRGALMILTLLRVSYLKGKKRNPYSGSLWPVCQDWHLSSGGIKLTLIIQIYHRLKHRQHLVSKSTLLKDVSIYASFLFRFVWIWPRNQNL